jgi:hypothetical protein
MAASTLILDYLGANIAASRPTAPAVPTGGLAVYYATDTGAVSLWSGASWVTIGVITPIASGDVLANITGSTAAPIGNTLSDVMDLAFGNSRGDILFRGASGWQVLAPGTSGKVLTTSGAGADPTWAAGGGGGGSGGIFWCDLLPGFGSAGDATAGTVLQPISSFTISKVYASLNVVTGQTFFAGIYKITSGGVITSVEATSSTFTATVSSIQAVQFPLAYTFATVGQFYMVACTRTDGSGSSAIPISSGSISGNQMAFRGAPIAYSTFTSGALSSGGQLASLSPAIGNSFSTFGGTQGLAIS